MFFYAKTIGGQNINRLFKHPFQIWLAAFPILLSYCIFLKLKSLYRVKVERKMVYSLATLNVNNITFPNWIKSILQSTSWLYDLVYLLSLVNAPLT